MEKQFAGDQKVGESILSKYEKKFVAWGVGKIPSFIETYHLTLLTILWSALNVIWGILAKNNLNWLGMVSLMIILQYITDLFDGAIGRKRNTGLIKWGFYMDHFLDYIFLCSLVFAGVQISPKGLENWYVVLLTMLGAFMVNGFLSFATTNEFKIYRYGLGPTELRIVFILVNIIIIYTGTNHFKYTLPLVVIVSLIALIVNTYVIQRQLWEIDMDNLKNKT